MGRFLLDEAAQNSRLDGVRIMFNRCSGFGLIMGWSRTLRTMTEPRKPSMAWSHPDDASTALFNGKVCLTCQILWQA